MAHFLQPKIGNIEGIGQGGFAKVYKAKLKFKGQVDEIAVKSMLYSDDPENVRTFYRELETLKNLDSPFVVRFIGERQINKSNET